jgi:hypothetical protein
MGKLVQPIAVLMAFVEFANIDRDLKSAVIIMASGPMLSISPMLG